MRVEVDSVSYTYRGAASVPALRTVSLQVGPGERVAVVGASGSGKSTLLLVLAGLLQPQQGAVRYDGRAIADAAGSKWLRRRVALALQSPEQQIFAASVWDEVMFAPLNLGLSAAEARAQAAAALAAVHLPPETVGQLSPFALSGGERRKVALASVLVMQPELLLLDEPLTGLSAGDAAQVWQAVEAARRRNNASCVMATHDVRLALQWADLLVVLAGGSVKVAGPPAGIMANPALLAEANLLLPPLDELACALAARGWALPIKRLWDARSLAGAIAAARPGAGP